MKDIDFLLQQLANQNLPDLPGDFEAKVWRKINQNLEKSSWKEWLWPWKLTPSLTILTFLFASMTVVLTHWNFQKESKAEIALDLTSFSSYPQNLPSTLLMQ